MTNPSSATFFVRVGTEQHSGSREVQEDCVGVTDPLNTKLVAHGGVVGVLADGMGGFSAGKRASTTAVDRFLEAYSIKSFDEPVRDALMRALFAANDAILRIPESVDSEGRVGTTLVAVAVHERKVYWISVGDSRAYLVRGDNLVQLTTDHTYATELQRQVAKKALSQDDADKHPERDVLTSYVGHPDLTDIDCNIKPLELEEDDTVILCSDGLYRVLSEDEIFEEVTGHPQEIANALVEKAIAKRRPGQDNASVVVLSCVNEVIDPAGVEAEYQEEWKSIDSTNRLVGALFIILGIIGLAWVYVTFIAKR